jgi:predicted ferric reductase
VEPVSWIVHDLADLVAIPAKSEPEIRVSSEARFYVLEETVDVRPLAKEIITVGCYGQEHISAVACVQYGIKRLKIIQSIFAVQYQVVQFHSYCLIHNGRGVRERRGFSLG